VQIGRAIKCQSDRNKNAINDLNTEFLVILCSWKEGHILTYQLNTSK